MKKEIPDIDIIDLDVTSESVHAEDDTSVHYESLGADDIAGDAEPLESSEQPAKTASKKGFRFNMHYALLLVAVLFIISLIVKFSNWGVHVDLKEIFKDGEGTYEDTLDEFLPLIRTDGTSDSSEPVDTIVAFGNAPFADDRDSEDGLANLIAKKTGATVYNCAISGSYLASVWPHPNAEESPIDAFNLYWMSLMTTADDWDAFYKDSCDALGDACPPEAEEVFQTLKSIDFNEVDVITIMYDASDYLAGHEMYSDTNSTDIQQFTGNLEAAIELFQSNYPNTRIIVMSPPYAYGIDDNGDYISSDIKTYGQDVLSTYVIKQYASAVLHSVTFVDNLYGTITEDNAKEYLTDNLHLNVKGREKIAERFEYALNYYRESQ